MGGGVLTLDRGVRDLTVSWAGLFFVLYRFLDFFGVFDFLRLFCALTCESEFSVLFMTFFVFVTFFNIFDISDFLCFFMCFFHLLSIFFVFFHCVFYFCLLSFLFLFSETFLGPPEGGGWYGDSESPASRPWIEGIFVVFELFSVFWYFVLFLVYFLGIFFLFFWRFFRDI